MIDQRSVATLLGPDVERRLGASAPDVERRLRRHLVERVEERVIEQGLRRETTLSLGTGLLIALQRIFGHRYRLRRRREVGFQLEVGPFEYVFEYAVSLVDRD